MTCKDCVHYDLCRSCSRIQLGWHDNRVRYVENIEEICKDFKDCSRFVELPCKVGDTVYVIESIDGEEKIIQDHVETMGIGYYADGINIYQWDGVKTDGYFEDFGKTVFLTREEAEQALRSVKEMNKELSIEEVIENLRAEYVRAKKKSFIAKPIAYALYSVWKAVDLTEKRRKLPHVENDNAN